MRIAQLHWAFPPVIGGVESHLAMLGPELVNNGHHVSLLTGTAPGAEEEEWYQGMYVRRTRWLDLNSLSPAAIEAHREDIRQILENFISRVQPDVIHAHNMHYFSPVHADILADIKERYGIPLVLTAHNVWADSDETWQEMNKRSAMWDAVIAVSGYIKKALVRVGYDARRITVIHHGIDTTRFSPPTAADQQEIAIRYPQLVGRQVIFHPARMSLDKGCHISVQALALLRRDFPNVTLVLAGTGSTVDWGGHQPGHVRQIRDLIQQLGLEKQVFIRFFPWQEMPLVYKAADFCIYPSCFQEPFGLVMLESMATARPVVVSRAGGMPEIIRDGINGYVVPMGDAAALAAKCRELLSDPRLCRQLGRQGRALTEKHWTKEVMTRSTVVVYHLVLQGYRQQPA